MKKPTHRRVAVIMAGGSGERFWPLSRAAHPKQLLRLTHPEKSLLEEAVERIVPLVDAENVYIATSAALVPAIRRAKLPIPSRNILGEPAKRNTAGCLCWVAAHLSARFGEEPVSLAILTADHSIGKAGHFRSTVKRALDAAEHDHSIVTIGVKPDRAETGYGYIEIDAADTHAKSHPVLRFREKPNRELAEDFVAAGNYYWNSGMFFWELSTFCTEMAAASPAHGKSIDAMAHALKRRRLGAARAAFEALPNISIDYALLEKSSHVSMVEADFPWDDVGSWDAIERSRTPDEHGNVVEGNAVVIESRGSIVLNEGDGDKIAVGVYGMENVIVIATKDAVLVVPKDRAQEVRMIVKELRARGGRQV